MASAEELVGLQSTNQTYLALDSPIISSLCRFKFSALQLLTDNCRHIPCEFETSVSALYRVDYRRKADLSAMARIDAMNAGRDHALQRIAQARSFISQENLYAFRFVFSHAVEDQSGK